MKKLIYLFLTVLIVACSSDDSNNDGDNNNDVNQNLVGTWVADFVDPENNEVYGNTTLILNVDNTGSVLSVFTLEDGENEVYSTTITWSSTTTTITFVYDDGEDDDVLTYNFITDDQLSLTDTEDGFNIILDRVN